MDSGNGNFIMTDNVQELKQLEKDYADGRTGLLTGQGLFRVGETYELNGSSFRISKITPKKLTLRLLPRT